MTRSILAFALPKVLLPSVDARQAHPFAEKPHVICANALKTLSIQLTTEFVRLCDLLKLGGLANSGGHGKQLVAAGGVTVDGQPESRKTTKIRAGQVVACGGVRLLVQAASPSLPEHPWNPESPKSKSN